MKTYTIIINNRQLDNVYVYDNVFDIYYRLQQHDIMSTPESILILNPNIIFPELYVKSEITVIEN